MEVKGLKKYTQEEWQNKAKSLFGKNIKKWRFKCPACGNTASIEDFVAAGVPLEKAVNVAYQKCIGRYTGTGSIEKGKKPCNWAAYGLFGTLGKGVLVTSTDGEEVECFDFAEPDKQKEVTDVAKPQSVADFNTSQEVPDKYLDAAKAFAEGEETKHE